MQARVQDWLGSLFTVLCKDPKRMPHYYQHMIETEGLERVVCDYIAGMTDRFVLSLYEKL